MGIAENITEDWHAALAALAWQLDLGATETIADAPVNRYELVAPAVKARPEPAVAPRAISGSQSSAVAGITAAAASEISAVLAAKAASIPELQAALASFDDCELKKGARNLVFAAGNPAARVMIIGEAPNRDEEQAGIPFAGRAGALLDKMFAAIGMSRDAADRAQALYLTTALPWRTPQDRDPSSAEINLLRPFLARHIALADPEIIVVMGNAPLQMVLESMGIQRARGGWGTAFGKPVLPMLHPARLLQSAAAKQDAWADLLALQSRLQG